MLFSFFFFVLYLKVWRRRSVGYKRLSKNQVLLPSGVKGKAMKVQQRNALRRAGEVPTLLHAVGLIWLKLLKNFQRSVRKDKLFSLFSV